MNLSEYADWKNSSDGSAFLQPDIEWVEKVRDEHFVNFVVSLFFDESASLLRGASYAWGGGNVRAKELKDFAVELTYKAQDIRRIAYGFTDNYFILERASFYKKDDESLPSVGSILSSACEHREFYERHDIQSEGEGLSKNSEATHRLVSAALSILNNAIRALVYKGAYGFARDIADRVEVLSESPCARIPQPPIGEDVLCALRTRAILRACEGLCQVQFHIAVHKWMQEKNSTGSSTCEDIHAHVKMWEHRMHIFHAQTHDQYGYLATAPVVDSGYKSTIEAVEIKTRPHSLPPSFVCYSSEDVDHCAFIVTLIINTLLRAGMENNHTIKYALEQNEIDELSLN